MEYVNHRKHSAGARNVKARAKRALLLPSNSNKLRKAKSDLDLGSFLIRHQVNFRKQ